MEIDSNYYEPKFFKMKTHEVTGETVYEYKTDDRYWQSRDKHDWSYMPKIYEDTCEPFH